jgi:heme A synthase
MFTAPLLCQDTIKEELLMATRAPRSARLQFEFNRIAAGFAALVVVGLVVFLLVRNEPISDPRLFFVLRAVLSFGVATLGATIPGFLNLSWSGSGLVIRAGGALALFVLTFVFTPDLVTDQKTNQPTQTINQSSTGTQSPPIVNNPGTINIIDGKK